MGMTAQARQLATVELKYLEAWRKHRHLSKHELAKRSDVHHNTIAAAERGHLVTERTARKLAAALEVEPFRLTSTRPPANGGR